MSVSGLAAGAALEVGVDQTAADAVYAFMKEHELLQPKFTEQRIGPTLYEQLCARAPARLVDCDTPLERGRIDAAT